MRLVLDGADLACSSYAPLSVASAGKTVIVLAEGTGNRLADGAPYLYDDPADDEPDAALFSRGDLSIYGPGSLSVSGSYRDGIASAGGLVIGGAAVAVAAQDRGIRGNDYLVIRSGVVTVESGGDGLRSDGDSDPAAGYVYIESGELRIDSGEDAIQAGTDALIVGGDLVLRAGGGSANPAGDSSAKGIKADASVIVDGGALSLDCADDGINASNGEPIFLYLLGGHIAIEAGDDGIDSNGSILMSGGTVIINGAPVDSCSTVDFDESFRITGGFLLGAGSDGMVQSPDGTSAQNSVVVRLGPLWPAGTLFDLRSSDGEDLFTFAPLNTFGSIVFSSPELRRGITYRIFYGGGSTGTAVDGLYRDGVYTPGTELASFTVSRVVTTVR